MIEPEHVERLRTHTRELTQAVERLARVCGIPHPHAAAVDQIRTQAQEILKIVGERAPGDVSA